MHNRVLRTNVQRAYFQIASVWYPFAVNISRIARWKHTQQSTSFAILYFSLWYYKLLLPTICVLLALLCWNPAIFDQPILGVFRSTAKQVDDSKIEQDAQLLGDEVDTLMGLSGEIASSADYIQPEEPAPSVAASLASTVTAPVTRSFAVQRAIASRISEHGRPIQLAAGDIADLHERFRNTCSGRSGNNARFRFVAILLLASIGTYFVSFATMARYGSFFIGVAFFGSYPLYKKSSFTRKLLDPQRTIFLGMPTNAQLYLSEMQSHPEWLVMVSAVAVKPELVEESAEPEVSDKEVTNSPPSSPVCKVKAPKRSWSSVLKTAIDLVEKSSEMATGQQPISFAQLRNTVRGQSQVVGSSVDSLACFAVYGTQRGHLSITATHLQFFAGIHFKRNEAPTPVASLEIKSISSIRKTQALQAVEGLGFQGVGDGLEIKLEDETVHHFKQVRRRDEAFLRLLLAGNLHRRWIIA